MNYLCILIAVGMVALGALVGSVTPLGPGSAVVIGGALGVVAGCLYIDAARKHNWHPLLRSSQNQQSSDINQKVLKSGMLSAQQAHIIDQVKHQDMWKR